MKIIPNGIILGTTMKGSPSKSDRTKSFIIERTASVFNKKGFAGTSLSDLTEATGLTKGALYGNFENKEDIALAVFDFNTASLRNSLHARASVHENSIDKLMTIPQFCRENFHILAAQGGCPVVNTASEADDTQPLLKRKVNHTISRWKKNLELTILQGIRRKEIKSKTDPSRYASLFIALFEGGILLSKSTGDISFLNHCADRMEEIIKRELKA